MGAGKELPAVFRKVLRHDSAACGNLRFP